MKGTTRSVICSSATIENVTEDITTVTEEQITERVVPFIATRNVYQPKTITTVQPIERQILRGTTESITEATRYEEERLPVRIETAEAPQVVENITPRVTERTVLEVEPVKLIMKVRPVLHSLLKSLTTVVRLPMMQRLRSILTM